MVFTFRLFISTVTDSAEGLFQHFLFMSGRIILIIGVNI